VLDDPVFVSWLARVDVIETAHRLARRTDSQREGFRIAATGKSALSGIKQRRLDGFRFVEEKQQAIRVRTFEQLFMIACRREGFTTREFQIQPQEFGAFVKHLPSDGFPL
jgi:hypothetical protein